jgi:hypothetical protein
MGVFSPAELRRAALQASKPSPSDESASMRRRSGLRLSRVDTRSVSFANTSTFKPASERIRVATRTHGDPLVRKRIWGFSIVSSGTLMPSPRRAGRDRESMFEALQTPGW